MGTRISQQQNYRGDFGFVPRSSAIFYCRQSRAPRFETTITFLNYWPLKRGNQVTIIASLRDMGGKLVHREELPFDEGHVRNYRPAHGEDFEGSVELEAFSAVNLVIPYAAIAAVYETERGVSFVHSYARAYSRHEVEEGRTISDGEEGCWTLRDAMGRRSFAVFHNGPEIQPAQTIRLTVTNLRGESRSVEIRQPDLPPYATVKVRPAEVIQDLPGFLGGSPGFGRLSFRLNEGFTRMLVGTETIDGSDFQVTHSNFDYGKHDTDRLADSERTAFMYVGFLPDVPKTGIVYPDSDPGAYFLSRSSGERVAFRSGEPVLFDVSLGEQYVMFEREGGGLPSRIVTALVASKSADVLPAECSLGVVHARRPPKRMWWGACAAGPSLKSRLVAVPLRAVYGDIGDGQAARLTLYAASTKETLERTLGSVELAALGQGRAVDELFPDAPSFLGDAPGYFTLTSDYGGLWCFSTLEKDTGAFAFEHGF